VTESEDVIGEAGGIGVMLLDPQLGLVMEQAIEHMCRIANGGVDDLGMGGCVLIGDVSVEGDAGVNSHISRSPGQPLHRGRPRGSADHPTRK
jgi:hypothetical protein